MKTWFLHGDESEAVAMNYMLPASTDFEHSVPNARIYY